MLVVRLFCVLLFVGLICCTSYEGDKVFHVYVSSESQVDSLKVAVEENSGLSFWTEKYNIPGHIDIQVAQQNLPSMYQMFEELEISYEIIHENLQRDIDELFFDNMQIKASEDSSFFDAYATYDQMQAYLKQLQADYANMTSLVNIGKTLEGRDITGIVISTSSKDKPKIVINGCQHAREWISPMTVAYVAQYLLQNYTTEDSVKAVVDAFEWTIIPIVNGDGYVWTWTDDRLWRKNRRNNPDSACYGVDINRNWDFEWGTVGSNFIKCSDTYAGTGGFSEPEETAVANYISKASNVVGYIDFHAYGELFMYPWGYTCTEETADDQTQNSGAVIYARAVKSVNGLVFQTGSICKTIYAASGDSADWAYGDGNVVYSYACELRGDSFILPPDQIIPSGRETFAGVVAWSQYISNQIN